MLASLFFSPNRRRALSLSPRSGHGSGSSCGSGWWLRGPGYGTGRGLPPFGGHWGYVLLRGRCTVGARWPLLHEGEPGMLWLVADVVSFQVSFWASTLAAPQSAFRRQSPPALLSWPAWEAAPREQCGCPPSPLNLPPGPGQGAPCTDPEGSGQTEGRALEVGCCGSRGGPWGSCCGCWAFLNHRQCQPPSSETSAFPRTGEKRGARLLLGCALAWTCTY